MGEKTLYFVKSPVRNAAFEEACNDLRNVEKKDTFSAWMRGRMRIWRIKEFLYCGDAVEAIEKLRVWARITYTI